MGKARLLDLYCCDGGAAMGYHRAGFDVTGVDIMPRPRYPFAFILADALAYIVAHGHEYDAIHASPPCQRYSTASRGQQHTRMNHPDLVAPTRRLLVASGLPWIMENVVGSPLLSPVMLCGTMFRLQTPCGADLRRHRLFETSWPSYAPGACRHASARTITVTGSTPQRNIDNNRSFETFSVDSARIAMGIDWMPMKTLSQAIPPAYTEYLGHQLMNVVQQRMAA